MARGPYYTDEQDKALRALFDDNPGMQYIELGKKIKAVGTAYNGGVTKLQDGGRSITTSAKQVISLGTKLSKGKELNIPEEIPEIGSAE